MAPARDKSGSAAQEERGREVVGVGAHLQAFSISTLPVSR